MLLYSTESIFLSTANCLVNPVNCLGVMGKGLALDFKHKYPDMFITYKELCHDGSLHVGQVVFYAAKRNPSNIICLFPTKHDWREPSTISILDASFQAFIKYAPEMKIQTAAFPKVGCGLGGLNFELQVRPLFEKYFTDSKLVITVHI